MEALLLCCWNDRPLPEWVAAIVIRQAEETYEHGSRGPGRHGNWRAVYNQLQIHRRRADLVEMHMQARRQQGRSYVSPLGRVYGYGNPTKGGENIVTRKDIFDFVSSQLRKSPARGEPPAIAASYRLMKSGPRRRRRRGGK